VPTIIEIRINNLNRLIDEYGSMRALAEAINRAPSVVSQMRSGRTFGERLARHTEESLGLPNGYLDSESSETTIDTLLSKIKEAFELQKISADEKLILTSYRKIPVSKRKLVMNLLNELSEKNS
jgi:hypothetical protein